MDIFEIHRRIVGDYANYIRSFGIANLFDPSTRLSFRGILKVVLYGLFASFAVSTLLVYLEVVVWERASWAYWRE